jgi:DNA-binding transcriptional LysR family regulator
MSEFLQLHPEVKGELLFVDRVVNLVEEGIDAAIRIGRLADSSLAATPLGAMRRVVCASPAYLRARGAPRRPQDLAGHRCVRFTGLAPHDEWIFREPARKVSIASVMTCNQADAAIEACAAGLGLGSFLSYMVAPLVRAGKLRYVLEEFEVEPLPVTFLYPQSRMLSPTVRAFADLCARRLRTARFD